MKHRLALLLAVAAGGTGAAVVPTDASAHRSGCHRWHSCPSDHATYQWRGMLCVKPSSDARTSAFRKRVVYEGLTYYCKR